MKALLLIAHGSRRQASNDEVKQLAEKLKTMMDNEYPIVLAGFLELAEPLIPDGLEQCKTLGANEIYVVPYFLSAGRHVQKDVPEEINAWQKLNSNIQVHQLPYIGSSPMMLELIKQGVGLC